MKHGTRPTFYWNWQWCVIN